MRPRLITRSVHRPAVTHAARLITRSVRRPAVTHSAPTHHPIGAQACSHTRGPDSSMFLREGPGDTQNLPVSLLQKRQKMTARTYNQHELTRTKEKAQEVSGDRQGRHMAGALRGRRGEASLDKSSRVGAGAHDHPRPPQPRPAGTGC